MGHNVYRRSIAALLFAFAPMAAFASGSIKTNRIDFDDGSSQGTAGISASSTTANYLSKSSATATYLNKGSNLPIGIFNGGSNANSSTYWRGDGTWQVPPGSGGVTTFSALTDVDDSGKAIDLVPKWNGSIIVWATPSTSFAFSVASFSDSIASVVEIGAGTWKTAGAVTFAALYTNGPATGAYVSKSGWSNLDMTGAGYLGPTNSAASIAYPSVSGTVVFTLNGAKGAQSATSTITHYFYNKRFWGVSSVTSGYTESNIEGLANNELSDSKAKSFTLTPTAGEYIVYSYPTRLGTATFFVGGFEGGFNAPETVSVTNPSGYTENYYVYRSANANLGATTVTTQ